MQKLTVEDFLLIEWLWAILTQGVTLSGALN